MMATLTRIKMINFSTIIIAVFIGVAAGYLGSAMVLKRMSLVGDALSHVALPGMALAILYGINPFIGALVFLVFGILLVWKMEKSTKLPVENLVGIIFTASLAIGILITPEPELIEALFGDIASISFWDFPVIIISSLVIFFITRRIIKPIIFSIISDDLARVRKINIDYYNLLYLFMVAVIVALGVKFIGSLLMGALVIIPAAAAKNIGGSLKIYSYGAGIIGGLSAVFGVLISDFFGIPSGAAVVLTAVFIFILMLLYKKIKRVAV